MQKYYFFFVNIFLCLIIQSHIDMSLESPWNGKLEMFVHFTFIFRYFVETLCGCTKDCGVCCYGYWCTPCLFGSNAKKLEDKNCFLMCCAYLLLTNCYLCWIPHMFQRKKLRQKYNLKEEPAGDCVVTLCCSPCALCQEAREMKSRGKLIAMNIFV